MARCVMWTRVSRQVCGSLLLLVALCTLAIVPGCGPKPTEPDGGADQEIVISEETFIVDDVEDVWFDHADSNTVVLGYAGEPPDLQADDILVAGEGGGYLRKVVSVTVDGAILIVETSDATLSDVIEKGTLQFEGVLDPWGAMRERGTLEQFKSTALPGVSIDEDGWHFSNVDLFDDDVGGVELEVTITEGMLHFTPDFDLGAHYGLLQGVTEFHAIAEGNIDLMLEVAASVSAALEHGDDVDLFAPIIVGAYPIPGLPLWMDVSMGMVAGFELVVGGEVSAEVGIDGDVGVRVGARWEQGSGWENVWEPELDLAMTEQWGMQSGATVRVYVKPYIATRLVSTAGPYIAADPYLKYEVDLEPPEPNDWCWCLEAGVGAGLGFQVTIFGWELADYYATLVADSTRIASDCEGEPGETGTIVVDPDPDQLNAPWVLSGPQPDSGDGDETLTDMPVGEYTLTWGAVSGYITPSQDVQDLDSDGTITFPGTYTPVGDDPEPPPMIEVPSGEFEMGDPDAYCADEHWVTLTHDFYLGQHEVTNQEYVEALQWALDHVPPLVTVTTASVKDDLDGSVVELLDLDDSDYGISFSGGTFTVDVGKEDHPVIDVTWYGAARYCDWLSMASGLDRAYDHSGTWLCNNHDPYGAEGYRLPTDAEWEYAAQYPDDRIYPWGGESPTCAVANYCGCGVWTLPVGSCSPDGDSYLGFWDLSGNVWEWCNDWYESYLGGDAETNPVGETGGSYRVVRGGSWDCYGGDNYLRCAARTAGGPDVHYYGSGFRAARTVNP